MIYLELFIQITAINAGITEIYNKKILKKEGYELNFIFLFLALVVSINPCTEIAKYLLFIISVLLLFIMGDKLVSKIKRIHVYLRHIGEW